MKQVRLAITILISSGIVLKSPSEMEEYRRHLPQAHQGLLLPNLPPPHPLVVAQQAYVVEVIEEMVGAGTPPSVGVCTVGVGIHLHIVLVQK